MVPVQRGWVCSATALAVLLVMAVGCDERTASDSDAPARQSSDASSEAWGGLFYPVLQKLPLYAGPGTGTDTRVSDMRFGHGVRAVARTEGPIDDHESLLLKVESVSDPADSGWVPWYYLSVASNRRGAPAEDLVRGIFVTSGTTATGEKEYLFAHALEVQFEIAVTIAQDLSSFTSHGSLTLENGLLYWFDTSASSVESIVLNQSEEFSPEPYRVYRATRGVLKPTALAVDTAVLKHLGALPEVPGYVVDDDGEELSLSSGTYMPLDDVDIFISR